MQMYRCSRFLFLGLRRLSTAAIRCCSCCRAPLWLCFRLLLLLVLILAPLAVAATALRVPVRI